MHIGTKIPFLLFWIWLLGTLFLWALAFMPLPTDAPEWLTVARTACFGSTESGLPDGGGWILLTLAPLSMFVALCVVWPRELKAGFGKFLSKPAGIIVAVAIALTIVVFGISIVTRINTALVIAHQSFESELTGPLPDNYPERNVPAHDFELIDHLGEEVQLSKLAAAERVTVLTFAFANCKTICPAIVHQAISAHERIDDDRVSLLVVTLDPWRDTPATLASWANRISLPKNAHLLSGEVSAVERVLQEYQIPYQRDERSGDVDHPALTHIIGSEGNIVYTMGNVPSDWIVQGARRVLDRDL